MAECINKLETKHINLTVSLKWHREILKVASERGITAQDLIRDIIGRDLKLLPGA